jgi:hypothetical protein
MVMMPASRCSLVVAPALVALLMAACAAPTREDYDSTSDELRALSTSEIVGTIAYGETKTVAYTKTPLYRALALTAEAGDEVSIDVKGEGTADARAWLLRSTFGSLASNDDATPTTKDANVHYTFTKAGTYYVTLRENARRDATFQVTVTKVGGAVATDAGPPPAAAHPALPTGPVALDLEGYGRGENAGRGVPIEMKCHLAGSNPGPVDVSCVVKAPYDGMGFSAKGTLEGDGASLHYRYDATSTSGTRYTRRGDVGISFIRRGDSLWARMGASYESRSGFESTSFGTLYPALITVAQGGTVPTELQSNEEESCDTVCRSANLTCLSASAATSRWVAFEGCPGLSAVPSTMASCQTIFRSESGFTGRVCDSRMHCQCI